MNINRDTSEQWLNALGLYGTCLDNRKVDEENDLYGNDEEDLYGPSTPEPAPSVPFEICINNQTQEFSIRQLSPEDKLWRKLSINEIIEVSEKCIPFYDQVNLKLLNKVIKSITNSDSSLISIDRMKLDKLRETIKNAPGYSTKPASSFHQEITAGMQQLAFYSEMLDPKSLACWLMGRKLNQYQEAYAELNSVAGNPNQTNIFTSILKDQISNDIEMFEIKEISEVAALLEKNVRRFTKANLRELENDLIPRLKSRIDQLKEAPWFSESFEICKLFNSCQSEIGKLKTNFNEGTGFQVEICNKITSYTEQLPKAIRFADEVIAFIQYDEVMCADRLKIYTDLLDLKLTLDEFMKLIGEVDRSKNQRNSSVNTGKVVKTTPKEVTTKLQELLGLPIAPTTYQEIKKAYRSWIFTNHPDKTNNANAAEKSKEVIEVFQRFTQICKDGEVDPNGITPIWLPTT